MKWYGCNGPTSSLTRACGRFPATRPRTGTLTRVPLTTPVVALLREQRASVPDGPPWVFSNMRGSGSVHHQARKGPGQLTQRLGFHFRGHDLRRTVATGMAESGCAGANHRPRAEPHRRIPASDESLRPTHLRCREVAGAADLGAAARPHPHRDEVSGGPVPDDKLLT